MKVIGLIGKLQSGKSTTGNIILEKYCNQPCVKTAFGNLLKEMILNSGLCNENELWHEKTDFSRLMMQKIGTEIIRKQVDPNFWVKKMKIELEMFKNSNDTDPLFAKSLAKPPGELIMIIDDVRFQNEAELVKEYGGTLIRIVRPSLNQNREANKHDSETEQDNIKVDYEIINDSSIEDLGKKVNEILGRL
jgi:hypothetical protein